MVSLPFSRLFAVDSLCLLVMLVLKIVNSVQNEKCLPHVDHIKYWAQVGEPFKVNCTIMDCDSIYETAVWQRNGKRVRNYRTNQVSFPESKRQTLIIDPIEEIDKGEYSCRTQIHGHDQTIQLIIGVEPTTPTTTTITTTTTTTTTTSPTTSTTSASSSTKPGSTATAILKVTTTPIRIIKTTQLPLPFTNTTKPGSGANTPRQFFQNLSVWTSLLVIVFKYT